MHTVFRQCVNPSVFLATYRTIHIFGNHLVTFSRLPHIRIFDMKLIRREDWIFRHYLIGSEIMGSSGYPNRHLAMNIPFVPARFVNEKR